MRMFAVFAALLLAPGVGRCADFAVPPQKIVGAENPIPLGELVSLSVSAPATTANLVATSYDWKIFDGSREKAFARDSDGKVFFGSGLQPKTLLAVVAITHLYTVQEGGQVKQVGTRTVILTATVTIGEPAPAPAPAPTPPPPTADVDPTFPAGRFELSKLAYASAKARVPAASRSAAQGVAAAFRSVSGQIKSGGLKTEAAILDATAKANEQALGASSSAWADFSEVLGQRLEELSRTGQLKTPADYAQAWDEISQGLDKVH